MLKSAKLPEQPAALRLGPPEPPRASRRPRAQVHTTSPAARAKAVAAALAPVRRPKPGLAGGDCSRCRFRPAPGSVFEETACYRCPYLGQRPGQDAEPREEGHGRVVSMDAIEGHVGGAHDPHGEEAHAHAADAADAGDFYAQIDAHLEADARRTAAKVPGTPRYTPGTDSQPIFHPAPILENAMEEPAKNTPNEKSELDAVPQEAIDVLVSALAELGQLPPNAIVSVLKRLGGASMAEIGAELKVTTACVSAALQRAAEKIPFLASCGLGVRGSKMTGETPQNRWAAMAESGRKYPAFAEAVLMAKDGRLQKWASGMFASGPMQKEQFMDELGGLFTTTGKTPIAASVFRLVIDARIVCAVECGTRIMCCLPEQEAAVRGAYSAKQTAKMLALPEVRRDGKRMPMLYRVGATALKSKAALPEGDWPGLGGAIQDALGRCFVDWKPCAGVPGMQAMACPGEKCTAWIFRRMGLAAFALTWKDDGDTDDGNLLWNGWRVWAPMEEGAAILGKIVERMRACARPPRAGP